MTRIATETFARQALSGLARTQAAFVEAQRQTAQQTIADDLQGFGRTSETLIGVNNLRARAQSFLDLGRELTNRLAQQDLALDRTTSAAAGLQQQLTEALTLDDGSFVGDALLDSFETARQGLNLRYAGRSLFNGTSTDIDPVLATQLSDLTTPAALGNIDTLFDNADKLQAIRVDEAVTITPAPFGREIGRDLFLSFQRVQQFIETNPTLGRPLTPAQRDFLTAEIALVSNAADGLRAAQAENGIQQARLGRLEVSQRTSVTLLTGVAGEIAEVDLAEVAARLSQARTQFQASASVFSQIQELSLVNFL